MSLGERRQYVYHCQPEQLQDQDVSESLLLLTGFPRALLHLRKLISVFGARGGIQRVARLLKGRRASLYLTHASRIVAECQLTFGHCVLYDIGESDVVLGPVWTDPRERGRGLATKLLSASGQAARDRGCPKIWIDTSEANIAMRRSIEKAGFPAESYVLLGDW